jgi:hypothetical protein
LKGLDGVMEVLDLAMLKAKTEERKIAGDECAKKRQELKELQELKLMAPDDEEKVMYDELIKAASQELSAMIRADTAASNAAAAQSAAAAAAAQLAPARSACGGARARATSSSARRTGCAVRPPLSPWKEARSQRRPAASSTDTATTGARAAPGARAASAAAAVAAATAAAKPSSAASTQRQASGSIASVLASPQSSQ